MFQYCYEIEKLDLSNFETSKVNNMSLMFENCNKLKYLNLSKFKLSDKCKTKNIFSFSGKCNIITKDLKLNKLYKK